MRILNILYYLPMLYLKNKIATNFRKTRLQLFPLKIFKKPQIEMLISRVQRSFNGQNSEHLL